jgi:hypothetical protein
VTGRERRSLERRRARDRIAVEPRPPRHVLDPRDVLARVAEKELVVARRAPLARIREALGENGEPLRTLRMVTGRVQARERRVRQDVDRAIRSSSSSDVPLLRARPTR